MFKSRSIAPILFGGAAALAGNLAHAQAYPTKPVKLITTAAGTGTDIHARLIAPMMGQSMGQSVVIDNRPSGVIPGQTVAQAAPDGYTFLYESSGFWVRHLLDTVPYDPIRDFAPVAYGLRQPALVVVNNGLGINTVKDLIAAAKAKPGVLNYATGSTGSLTHLAAELFQSMAGVEFQRVSYKNGADGMNDVVSGRVQIMFAATALLFPQVKAGKLKALAVTTAQTTPLVPGMQTIAASGIPGFESVSNTGVFLPAKTARPIIERLNKEWERALLSPELKEKWDSQGIEPVATTPEQFDAMVKAEITTTAKLVKERNIRIE